MVDNVDENAETTPMVSADETAPVPPVLPPTASVPVVADAAPAEEAPATRDTVHVPRRWLVWGGSALLALVVLGGVFSAGVAVGHRAGGVRGGIGNTEMTSPRMGVPGQGQGYGQGYGDGHSDGNDRSDGFDEGDAESNGGTGAPGESGGRMRGGHPWQNTPDDQSSTQAQ